MLSILPLFLQDNFGTSVKEVMKPGGVDGLYNTVFHVPKGLPFPLVQ